MEDITIQRQRELIQELARLVAERAHVETSVQASYQAREAAAVQQHGGERQRAAAQYQKDVQACQAERNESLSRAAREYEASLKMAIQQHERRGREAKQQAESELQAAQEEYEIAVGRLKDQYAQTVREAAQRLYDFKGTIDQRREEIRSLQQQAERLLRRRRCRRAARLLPEKRGTCRGTNALAEYAAHVAAAREALAQFEHHAAARFLGSGSLIAILLLSAIAAVLAGVPSGFMDSMPGPWLIVSGAISFGLTAIVYVGVRPHVVRQTLAQYEQFQQAQANAETALQVATSVARAEGDSRRLACKQQVDLELRRTEETYHRRRAEIVSQRDTRLKESADSLQASRQSLAEDRQRQLSQINQTAENRLRELETLYQRHVERLDERHQQDLATGREAHQRAWQRLIQRWTSGLGAFETAVDQMNDYCNARFPLWDGADWNTWVPPQEQLTALRFGHYALRLDMFENGLPQAEELRPVRQAYSLPAVLAFADRPSLLLEAWGSGRTAANRALQNVMLRLLTSLPPGKVQFTIFDPVGLGQNFSAFMHLADYDETLVNHRIWTETTHIQQRLADLTQHMEDVIQTYLRNEYTTIQQYNEHAGEVAEPYQVLVVANFPAGFSEEAAQRLLSIVSSGARCGVYTLISSDSKLELPRNFDLSDLEANAATLQWNGTRFHWLDPELKDLPLELETPPDDQRLTDVIRAVGQRAKEASRVEVPFATIVPPDDAWWTADSRAEIEVALGRAGASKLQYLRLGRGTAQHVLISGKTGSGKSTLLHVLITRTALMYGPDEVQFYLIDFKKGVEFKPYASYRMPHAAVVAIESEREFGMSVLERLDLELRYRGDLFRENGVQDIRAFRDAHPERSLPRQLLIIDEFQEFFVQDDKLAQEAALLLDRLVRQGRAFGIHVLLGSQTLAGAYSLARSTIGQMAVRIALQCSEADSHLILSEDNTAARLLRRPGEAIYNDANGLFEGNHPFQIVWLPAAEQEQYLQKLRARGAVTEATRGPPIVFEGNVAANPSDNGLLRDALCGPRAVRGPAVPRAWVGAAVSIKEPTSVAFHRQSGANLLIVGQQEDLALGVLATSLISLHATCPPTAAGAAPARFHVLDGTRPDSPDAGFWQRFARQVPVEIQVSPPAKTPDAIRPLAAEAARRQEAGVEGDPPIFLVIFGLSRFRELRRDEEDFGFSSFSEDKPQPVARQFTSLLRDGPAVGIHTLVWCDTYSNASRWLDRQTLRDLDHRVLFQMSATDSANLMDSPAASRLGVHRALLYSEEQGSAEKFRPYGPPPADWLAWLREQLTQHPATQDTPA